MQDFHRVRLHALCLLALLLSCALPARSQTLDATALTGPVDLATGWRVFAGDDPSFASPSFDDSHWLVFDARKSVRTIIPKGEPPVVWYRLRIRVNPGQEGLALRESNISRAFEIYVNGRRVMQTGTVAPFKPSTFDGILLAPIAKTDTASGSLLLALRVHISRFEWGVPTPGYLYLNLTLGQYAALHDSDWLQIIGDNAVYWLNRFTWLGLGIVALALYLGHRSQREYLWLFLCALFSILDVPFATAHYFHNFSPNWDLIRQVLGIASWAFQMLMYLAILRIRTGRWVWIAGIISGAGLVVSSIANGIGELSTLANALAIAPVFLLIAVVLPIILWIHFRRGNREAGILLIAALVQSLWIYVWYGSMSVELLPGAAGIAERLNLAVNYSHWGPFRLDFDSACSMLSVLSLSVIIVLRSTRISRQQAQMESDLEGARQVQQVILPESTETIPGFAVESVYHPAQQVGGDFFQVIPTGEGGMLVVVGDVAGKGLPAAMLVAILVGAVRGVANYTTDPGELLANLNERLVGRHASFSTALIAAISPEGKVSIANAGHPAPYLDGVELELPGALPLGVQSGAQYSATDFRLLPGSRLTFITDGVVEAQDQTGALFGFDRCRDLARKPALEIADAARRFGQVDDITVVSIERPAEREAAVFSLDAGAVAPATS